MEGLFLSLSLPPGLLKGFRSENSARSNLLQLTPVPAWVMDAGFVVTAESGLHSIPRVSESDTEMNLPHHKHTLCIGVI